MARILIDPDSIEDARVAVRGTEAKHLIKVLRAKPGLELIAFDGAGHEWDAIVEEVSQTSAVLSLSEPRDVDRESAVRLVLGVGVPKGDTLERVVRTVTELGVQCLVPVHTARSIPEVVSEQKLARLHRIAEESCKQCGRNQLPEIVAPQTLPEFVEASTSEAKWIFWEEGGDAITTGITDRAASATLLIGPEGGLSVEEVEHAKDNGFKCVTLGPRILRVDTAVIAAVTAIQLAWGDMG